jgi:hypothetical protein
MCGGERKDLGFSVLRLCLFGEEGEVSRDVLWAPRSSPHPNVSVKTRA